MSTRSSKTQRNNQRRPSPRPKPEKTPPPGPPVTEVREVRVFSFGRLSESYFEYFDVKLPPSRQDSTELQVVRVRRLTAAEDSEVNLIIRRAMPASLMGAQTTGEPVAMEQQEKDIRMLEAAQVKARALALVKAVPLIGEGLKADSVDPSDLVQATTWLQERLPENVLAALYAAVVGEPASLVSGRALHRF